MNNFIVKFLINLKNHSLLKKEKLICNYSSYMLQILVSLYKEGFIQSCKLVQKTKIVIILRYYYNKPVLKNLKLLSLPSKLKFLSLKTLSKLSDKKFVLFLSTTKGILTLKECKKFRLGGKALFYC